MKSELILLLFFFLVFGHIVNAQKQVVGEVYSLGTIPLSDVNVMLLQQDSTVVTGCASDSLGRFVLNVMKEGDYLLFFSCLGYQVRSFVISKDEGILNVGRIILDTLERRLEEVEALSPLSVRNKDRRIYYPTQEQLKHITNGLTLLHQLSIPFLSVNIVRNSVESIKGDVKLAINGKMVDQSEVLALRPEDILRVESIEYPGIRYENAAMAINYVTKIKETGGMVGIDLTDFCGANGSDNFFFKKNQGKSELGLKYGYNYGDYKAPEESRNVYRFTDHTIERSGKSEDGYWKYNYNTLALNYNNREQDKYYFNSTLSGRIWNRPGRVSNYNYEVKDESFPLLVRDSFSENYKESSLDLYLERQFKGNRTFIFNVVGTYHDSELGNIMRYEQNGNLLNVINPSREGEKYSVIGEMHFEKRGTRTLSTLTLKHWWNKANNNYLSVDQKIRLSQYCTAAGWLTETDIKAWKLYTIGNFYRIRNRDSERSETKWSYYLQGCVAYNFSHGGVVYALETGSEPPTTSRLDEGEYSIDEWVVGKGNFHLVPERHIRNRLAGEFEHGAFNFYFQAQHIYQWNHFSSVVYQEENRFILQSENQKYWSDLYLTSWVRWNVVQNYLSINCSVAYHNITSRGDNYKHNPSFFNYQLGLTGMYKNWTLFFEIRDFGNDFEGEVRYFGKKEDFIALAYSYGDLSFGASLYCFLDRGYKRSFRRSYNALIPFSRWSEEPRNMLVFKLSYFFSWGKQKEGYNQRVKNVDTDRGINTLK